MENGNIPRRVFLKSCGIMLLLSGCSAQVLDLVRSPTATPLPTPTPTPLPRSDAVAQAYLSAWSNDDYATMHSLLSPASQARYTPDQINFFYLQAMNRATVQQVETQLQSLLYDGDQARVLFKAVWHTFRFGTIEVDNQMTLKFNEGRWGVEWQPTLVLPHLGEDVTLSFLSEQPTRGNIYDSDFHALASEGQLVTIGVVPQYLADQTTTIYTLADITGLGVEDILAKIEAAQPDWFVPIADVSFETSLQFDELLSQMLGVDRRARSVRIYNDGDIAAHVIGFMGSMPPETRDGYIAQGYTGDELVGLSGVEAWAEAELAGQRGGRLVTLSPPPARQVLSELAAVTSRAGSSVHLTLDTLFQTTVEQLLGQRKGAVVVMDANTGAIYAMANYPRFQPAVFTANFDVEHWTNLYSNEDRPLLNRATQGTYPPGSVFKIVSLTAALEALGIDPTTTFTCTGTWPGLGPHFEKKWWLEGGHGPITLIDGLTQSCNVVFYEVGLALHRTNPDFLPDWARAYGLGARTNILGLFEESQAVVPDQAWKQATYNQPLFDGDAVNTAIGQGFMLATPLQIVRMLAALGNGGKLLRPYLIQRIVAVNGSETITEPEVSASLSLLPETMALIRSSLAAITSGARGTARQAFEGATYTVAGKTGTAESGQGEPHAWFAGYAPADEARVAISVVLEHGGEGSKVAAPLFRQVLEAYFAWEATRT